MWKYLPLLLLALTTEAGAQEFPDARITPKPAIFQCEDFCGNLFGEDTEKLRLCKEGCAQGQRCTDRCAETFAGNDDGLARCKYRCARAR